jgi:hypothetical protein
LRGSGAYRCSQSGQRQFGRRQAPAHIIGTA